MFQQMENPRGNYRQNPLTWNILPECYRYNL